MEPIGDSLDDLVSEEVLKEGTGLTLGVTPTMMKFLNDSTPYIGKCMSVRRYVCMFVAELESGDY